MDHTQLETLQRCDQEFVYRHVRHLTSAEESIASFFGRVVHEGVKAFYNAEQVLSGGVGGGSHIHEIVCDVPGLHVEHDDFFGGGPPNPGEVAAAACEQYWQQQLEAGLTLPEPRGDKPEWRTPQLAQAIVRLYAARWPQASRGYRVVLNECSLPRGQAGGLGIASPAVTSTDPTLHPAQSLRLADRQKTISECGVLDRVVRREVDGLLYVLDLKTSAWSANSAYWRQWSNSQQAAIYLDLAEAELGEGIAGFWCDHIFLSARRDGPRPEDFMQYGPVAYSPAKRAEMRAQRARWRELAEHLRALPGEALQSTRSCFRFNSACPYLDYCAADPADREDMLTRDQAIGKLVVRPRNPKERDA